MDSDSPSSSTLADRLRAQASAGVEDLCAALGKRSDEASGDFGPPWLALVRDAYEGTGGFRAATRAATRGDLHGPGSYENGNIPTRYRGTYLAQFPREEQSEFQRRVESSTYLNLVAPIVDTYHGHLTRRAPRRESVSVPVTAWWASADSACHSVDEWLSVGIQRAQLYGWCAALFDREAGEYAAGTVATRATWLEPEEVLAWEMEADGSLEWVRLGSECCEVDPITGAATKRYEYSLWTCNEWARVVVVELDGSKHVERIDGGVHGLGRVPIAILRWRPRLDARALYGVSQVSDVVPLALGLFNTESQLTHHLANAVFAILAVQSDDANVFADLKLGTNNGMRYPMSAASPAFIAAPESVSIQLAMRGEQLVDAIYQAARLERPKAIATCGDPASGIARGYDFAQTEAILQGFVKRLTAFEHACAALVALWDRAPVADPDAVVTSTAEAVTVEYPTRFDVRGLQDELAGQFAVLTQEIRDQLPPSARRHARQTIAFALNPEADTATEKAIRSEAGAMFDADVKALSPAPSTEADHATERADAIAALSPVGDAAFAASEATSEIPTDAPAP